MTEPIGDSATPPRVSVVVPCYNRAELLDAALRSVAAQTFRDFEIVVVDDGSTDGTPLVLAEWERRGARVLRQANRGPSAARNNGVRAARGELLAFLDSDDLWRRTYREEIVAVFDERPDVGLVAPAFQTMHADGRPTRRLVGKKSPGPVYTTRTLLQGDVGTIINPVIRRELFLAVGGYDETLRSGEDCDLWLRLSCAAPMRHLPRPLMLYRQHPGNISRDVLANARCWLALLEKLERTQTRFARENRALLRRAAAKQRVRLARELFLRDGGPVVPGEARAELRRAIAADPLYFKARAAMLLAVVPGAAAAFRRIRGLELNLRRRWTETAACAWINRHRRAVRPS